MSSEFMRNFMAGWGMGQQRLQNQRMQEQEMYNRQQDEYRRQQEMEDRALRQQQLKLQEEEIRQQRKRAQLEDALREKELREAAGQMPRGPVTAEQAGIQQTTPADVGPTLAEINVPRPTQTLPSLTGGPDIQMPIQTAEEQQAERQRKMREALMLLSEQERAKRRTPEEIQEEAFARARGERMGAPPVGPREPQGSFQEAVGPDGKPILFNSTTGEVRPYPAGVTPKLTRTQAPTGAERQALAYYNRANEALTGIEGAEDNIAKAGLGRQLQTQKAPPWLQTEEQRQYRQRQRAFTEARLRKESGAAIPEHEFETDARTYFAVPGDTPETIERKRAARQKVIEGLAFSSGKAYDEFYGEPFKRQESPKGEGGGSEVVEWVRGPDGRPRRK